MTKFEALKESIKDECIVNEPLAEALIAVLESQGLIQRREVFEMFDELVERDIGLRIKARQKFEKTTQA